MFDMPRHISVAKLQTATGDQSFTGIVFLKELGLDGLVGVGEAVSELTVRLGLPYFLRFMPMEEPSQSLINVSVSDTAGLSKPADSLVNRFFDAIGVWLDPRKVVRDAQAEVDAALIRAHGDIMLTDLQARTAMRRLDEESQRQKNLESIAAKALSLLKPEASPEKVDPDWMAQFLEKARLVSNEEMQTLWAKILAGEACGPGSFSKRTLSIVADLDKTGAELFTKLRSLCFEIMGRTVVVSIPNRDGSWPHLKDHEEVHLQSLGLIEKAINYPYSQGGLPRFVIVTYGTRKLRLKLSSADKSLDDNPAARGYYLTTFNTTFTPFGSELAGVCAFEQVDSFFEAVKRQWYNNDPVEVD